MKKLLNKKTTQNVANWLRTKKIQLTALMYSMIFVPMTEVYAGGTTTPTTPTTTTAEDKWTAMINFMLPWISRLGGVVILIGAIEFGLAFKSDDAEGKTKGMRTAIAGCIVFAVGMSADTFLY